MAIVRCARCGGINRIAEGRAGDRPICGRCKSPLDVSGAPQQVNGAGLQQAVESAPVPVLVDFGAIWCGPCRMVEPIVDSIARSQAGKALVLKVDIDADQAAAALLRVQAVPTFVLFQGGKEVARRSGAASRAELEAWMTNETRRAAGASARA